MLIVVICSFFSMCFIPAASCDSFVVCCFVLFGVCCVLLCVARCLLFVVGSWLLVLIVIWCYMLVARCALFGVVSFVVVC